MSPVGENPLEHDEQLAVLLARLTDAAQRGEPIDIDDICRSHPELAGELRQLWGAVLVAEAAGSHGSLGDWPEITLPARRELPARFGNYDLLEEIGRGGMGVVYRARQLNLDREVAVKMIVRGPFATPEDRQRFAAEAEAAGRLGHPGIVQVLEVGETEGQPYFSMKYIPGETLAEILSRGPMAPREAARILEAVCRAVDFAHRRGILHRDLKPSNILFDEEGVPHVTDFGLAKRVTGGTSLTHTGAILGTPAYMSPEQATGGRASLGPTSDVYSLGAILYHMLTGQSPFVGQSPMDVLLQIREQDVTPPRVINPRVDRNLEMIALRCLQKPEDLRYPTASALADDLHAYLYDEPIAARSGRFTQVVSMLFRETHHAIVLENWGLLWMWHSLALLTACVLTNALHWAGYRDRFYYIALWTAGLGTWAAVFWHLRRRVGPVTFVERQIAHVWGASLFAIGGLFFVEILLGLPVLTLSPILALISGMVFFVKAGILSGAFYLQALALFATAFLMARWPAAAHLLFGTVAAACFFFPGLKYYRQRRRAQTTST